MEKGFIIKAQQYKTITLEQLINVNIGILGHVDSGKTTLCKTLTQVHSTACLDKSPQSKEKGITLDLGFSALYTYKPPSWIDQRKYVQITLVDCPGHASLIRTVIGGAQIIDAVILVIDVIKGMQIQTAQCLAIAELLVPRIVILLNKCDQIPQEEREKTIIKKIDLLKKNIFSKTKFGTDIPFIPFSAIQKKQTVIQTQIQHLLHAIFASLQMPHRKPHGPMLMLSDHCFFIKGKGCVFTGTITQGQLKINDEFQLPEYNQKRKVKSLQVFHRNVDRVRQGDRVALMTQVVDGDKPQRSILCSPGLLCKINTAIIELNKIPYFKMGIKTKQNFHIISGHQTIMASCRLFYSYLDGASIKRLSLQRQCTQIFNKNEEEKEDFTFKFDIKQDYEVMDNFDQADKEATVFAKLKFQKPLLGNIGTYVIGSKLDIDQSSKVCRLAFHGHILHIEQEKDHLSLYKWKQKKGEIDRQTDQQTLIIRDLFAKQADLTKLSNQKVSLSNGQTGIVLGTFGKSGKLKVRLQNQFMGDHQTTVLYKYKKYYK